MELSVGELICEDFNRYLKDLEKEERCVLLPFKIRSLNLKNIRKFSEKHLDLVDVNIIHGNNGTGKSTILKSISSIYGNKNLVKSGQNKGQINMILSDGSSLHQNIFNDENIRCIVLDEGAERLDKEHYDEFLRYLSKLNIQLILLLRNMNDDLNRQINMIFPNCRFISLN